MAEIINLNEGWKFYKTDRELKEENVTENVNLPHTWNAVDGQDGGNDYYRGTCFYKKNIVVDQIQNNECFYLEFKGVAMNAEVFLNGESIGTHEGGYSTFRFDVTNKIKAGVNQLMVSADNGQNATYPQNADFTFYGGIYRDVNFLRLPATHFDLDYYGASGIKVTPIVTDLESKTGQVTVEAWIIGTAKEITFNIADSDGNVLYEEKSNVVDGKATAVFDMTDVHLWDGLVDPYLYMASAILKNGEYQKARFGLRKMHVDPKEGFFLNGRLYPLRGVSRHQDRWAVGNALKSEMHVEDMELIKEMGSNSVRLAHYQHDQQFYDLCDENGIIVWAEIPYITMHVPAGRENTISQMTELIAQCYNHACIFCWGLSNEISVASTMDEDLFENHRILNELCHEMDKTRPTTMANAFMLETSSKLLEIPDMNTYNLYFGWYMGELTENEEFFDKYHREYPERCIGFSEYGADTNIKFHSIKPDRGDYTEEYQCLYHEHILDILESRPWIWCSYVWNMFDFAADGRDEGGAHGLNQKGLVTFDRKTKKDAFYLYKAWWSTEKFVYITGRRYVNRAEEVTHIKVYSNEEKVALYIDGNLLQEKTGKRIFEFDVPISKEHIVEARTDEAVDTITIKKVDKPDESYSFTKQPDIVNWFDKEPYKPECYSIYDKVGDVKKSEGANAVLEEVFADSLESRGDIAKAASGNKALEGMINRQTVQNLLKLAGAGLSEEDMRDLNTRLQTFKKVD